MRRRYTPPTKSQLAAAKKRQQEREDWFNKNQSYLDWETSRMANHPGFLGGVSREEARGLLPKEAHKLYPGL